MVYLAKKIPENKQAETKNKKYLSQIKKFKQINNPTF